MRFLAGLFLVLATGVVCGQVTVEVVLDQEQYLRDEPVVMELRIRNQSGRPLALEPTDRWLSLHVESLDGFLLAQRQEALQGERVLLSSSAVATQRVDLTLSYDLGRAGRYQATANVLIPGWDKSFSSKPCKFDISKGVTLWRADFGVPSTGGAPEVRRYAIQRANYVSRPTIYVRVSDPSDTQVFGVCSLGPIVSFSRPEHKIDDRSRLHTLFQSGARTFKYHVVDPDGRVVIRQTHSYFNSRPKLQSKGGRVVVSGGIRRVDRTDLPPRELLEEAPAVPVP